MGPWPAPHTAAQGEEVPGWPKQHPNPTCGGIWTFPGRPHWLRDSDFPVPGPFWAKTFPNDANRWSRCEPAPERACPSLRTCRQIWKGPLPVPALLLSLLPLCPSLWLGHRPINFEDTDLQKQAPHPWRAHKSAALGGREPCSRSHGKGQSLDFLSRACLGFPFPKWTGMAASPGPLGDPGVGKATGPWGGLQTQ